MNHNQKFDVIVVFLLVLRRPEITSRKYHRNQSRKSPIRQCLNRLSSRIVVVSCVLRFQHKSIGRCGEILIGYLRDLQNLASFSFIDSHVSLGDVDTKNAGSLKMSESFSRTGLFALSFVGRLGGKAMSKLPPHP